MYNMYDNANTGGRTHWRPQQSASAANKQTNSAHRRTDGRTDSETNKHLVSDVVMPDEHEEQAEDAEDNVSVATGQRTRCVGDR